MIVQCINRNSCYTGGFGQFCSTVHEKENSFINSQVNFQLFHFRIIHLSLAETGTGKLLLRGR